MSIADKYLLEILEELDSEDLFEGQPGFRQTWDAIEGEDWLLAGENPLVLCILLRLSNTGIPNTKERIRDRLSRDLISIQEELDPIKWAVEEV